MYAATASSNTEEFEIIDRAIIDRYLQRSSKLIEMLVDAFLDEAPKHFEQIRSGVAANDYTAVRVSAHGLKSCSYNLGAIRLAEICKQLEAQASSGDGTDIEASAGLIGPTLFSTEEALKSIRMSAQSQSA